MSEGERDASPFERCSAARSGRWKCKDGRAARRHSVGRAAQRGLGVARRAPRPHRRRPRHRPRAATAAETARERATSAAATAKVEDAARATARRPARRAFGQGEGGGGDREGEGGGDREELRGGVNAVNGGFSGAGGNGGGGGGGGGSTRRGSSRARRWCRASEWSGLNHHHRPLRAFGIDARADAGEASDGTVGCTSESATRS